MVTAEFVALVALTFLLAGAVKGVVGLGLPTVALAVFAATVGLKPGMALILAPSLATNLWQGLAGGALGPLTRRLWVLLAASCVGAWFGVGVLAAADATLMTALLGALPMVYAGYSLATPPVPPPGRHERWLSPLAGAVGGVLTGMTGSFVVPGVLYLQALDLGRDALVQAMGIAFTVLTVALGVGLAGHGLLSADLGVLSLAAIVPAFAGMALGVAVRRRLSEARFRRVFFGALLLLGLYLAGRGLV